MNEIIGKKVIVYSDPGNGERQDIGVLEGVENQWIRLRKSDTEVLFFSVYKIRLVKPFDPH